MKRYTFHIDEEQLSRLENLPGNVSEHLRGAINDYLAKHGVKTSISPSTLTVDVCARCNQRVYEDDDFCPMCGSDARESRTLSRNTLV